MEDSPTGMPEGPEIDLVFSGHQSFSLRISWLPKAFEQLVAGIDPFSEPRRGMMLLGLGKNMVESLSFWVEATGIAARGANGHLEPTEFGRRVLCRETGYDPYLEHVQTLWLIHWNLCRGWRRGGVNLRPYAWHFYANILPDHEFSRSEAVDHFSGAVAGYSRPLSPTTLKQHFDVFIRTYVPGEKAGPRSTPEDALDSPLTTLGLIRSGIGHTGGRRDTIYRVDASAKGSISLETFRFALHDWWNDARSTEQRVTLRELSIAAGSPGRVFKLPESEVYDRVVRLANDHPQELRLVDSQNQRALERMRRRTPEAILRSIYRK